MKTSKNKKAIIVGLFTSIGLAIFLLGIFTLGGQHKLFVGTISVKASFDEVNGLQPGNNVWYQGVNIGTVKSVSLSENAKVDILLNIEKKSQRFIPNDARAKIGSDGFIGNKIVVIFGGTDEAPIIADGDTISAEKAFSTDQLAATLQKNNLNLLEITDDLKQVTHKIAKGEGTLGKLLNDDSILNDLQAAVTLIKQASVHTGQLTSNLDEYSSKLVTEGSFANDLATDTVIFSKLRTTVSQIQEVSKTMGTVADNLRETSIGLNDSTKPAGALIHDRQMADTLRVIFGNLKESSIKMDEDLEALQHNFLLRRYFKKKAKQEAKDKD